MASDKNHSEPSARHEVRRTPADVVGREQKERAPCAENSCFGLGEAGRGEGRRDHTELKAAWDPGPAQGAQACRTCTTSGTGTHQEPDGVRRLGGGQVVTQAMRYSHKLPARRPPTRQQE